MRRHGVGAAFALAFFVAGVPRSSEAAVEYSPARPPKPTDGGDDIFRQGETMSQKATFAAGCFWGVEAAFRQVPGVAETAVGYTGGRVPNPTYEDVCTDRTGHAEAVQVEFDPSKVSYDELLDVFWANHDPTTKNRQGPDVGTQYRSAIFVHDAEQDRVARESRDRQEKSGRFRRPIVTEIAPAGEFWRAEEYHQRYLEKRGLAHCKI